MNIDTIKMTLTRFRVFNPELFGNKNGLKLPLIDTLQGKTSCYYKIPSDGNFQSYLLEQHIRYLPHLYRPALIRVKDVPQLRERFSLDLNISLPKSVYGHNLYGFVDSQLIEVAQSVRTMLLQFGIEVEVNDILDCNQLQRIDYCQNILLEVIACLDLISLLKKLSKGKRYQTITEYSTSVIFKNKSQYLIVYDKLAEITSILSDKSYNNRKSKEYEVAQIIQAFRKVHKLEVLRVEHRLLNRQAIFRELEGLVGHKPPFTFREVFSSSISAQVLKKHWEAIAAEHKIKLLILGEKEVSKILDEITPVNKKIQQKFNPYLVILSKLVGEEDEEKADTRISNLKSTSSLKSYKKLMEKTLGEWETYDSRLTAYRHIAQSITKGGGFFLPIIPS